MPRRGLRWLLVLVVLSLALLLASTWRDPGEQLATAAVAEGEFAVVAAYSGEIQSRNVITIMSDFNGTATIVELAEEGAPVDVGDLLVRFDATQIEQELAKLGEEHAILEAELESLTRATLPLELRELQKRIADTTAELEVESDFLEDSLELERDNLISAVEVRKQRRTVENLRMDLESATVEYDLTRQYLHPAQVETARTRLAAAANALELARRQMRATVLRAPVAGVVVHKPLHIGGDFRTVRVGDKLYPNQPFMVIPDMQDLVVNIDVPESELANAAEGREAVIRPFAFPELSLAGTVEAVGSVARTLPGHPNWQKFFHARIGVDEVDGRIRPGMSVTTHIVSRYRDRATLIPRRAVSFQGGQAHAVVVGGDKTITRRIVVGAANDAYYEVINGVEAGEQVILR